MENTASAFQHKQQVNHAAIAGKTSSNCCVPTRDSLGDSHSKSHTPAPQGHIYLHHSANRQTLARELEEL